MKFDPPFSYLHPQGTMFFTDQFKFLWLCPQLGLDQYFRASSLDAMKQWWIQYRQLYPPKYLDFLASQLTVILLHTFSLSHLGDLQPLKLVHQL